MEGTENRPQQYSWQLAASGTNGRQTPGEVWLKTNGYHGGCATRHATIEAVTVTLRDAKTGIKDRYEPGM